ncbi:hypothetical protein A0H81_11265 [Grifola frondosa]|uniref:Uncharacterized protein n=1 Tax=Grifola frondosa TaxID=5627 RepID=A0A1C7LW22_GRIFR|nr:hypothetical protein A0H81_11265 [Grifola frondosa]
MRRPAVAFTATGVQARSCSGTTATAASSRTSRLCAASSGRATICEGPKCESSMKAESPGCVILKHLVLVHGRRAAVIEFVDMDARARRTRVDHKGILDERLRGRVRNRAVDGLGEVAIARGSVGRGCEGPAVTCEGPAVTLSSSCGLCTGYDTGAEVSVGSRGGGGGSRSTVERSGREMAGKVQSVNLHSKDE